MTEENDNEECAWCKFMKGGPCRTVFETWQACVDSIMEAPDGSADEESRKLAVEKCASVTGPLFACLAQHPEYYGPQLDSMHQRDAASADADAAASQQPAGPSSGSSSSGSSSAGSSGSRLSSTAVAGVQDSQTSVGRGKLNAAAV